MSDPFTLHLGDCLDILPTLDVETVHCVVCDPPYELGFMGKSWDSSGIAFRPDVWREVLRVLKPGGYLLAFGGSRTVHRIACAIEDAGFEIRDTVMWIYGSGFPKSLNVGKDSEAWAGWGSNLKPAHEPIVVARKPFKGTLAQNLSTHGVGAINIDACRIPHNEQCRMMKAQTDADSMTGGGKYRQAGRREEVLELKPEGRFPANVIHDGIYGGGKGLFVEEGPAGNLYGDTGSAARFFYCAKADRAERNEGLSASSTPAVGTNATMRQAEIADWQSRNGNHHPTVKPLELMRYLCRLVCPPGGVVLDPFTGSGSTGCAALAEGFRFVGIERELDYHAIAMKRLQHTKRFTTRQEAMNL